MRPTDVVPLDPLTDGCLSLYEVMEAMLPDAFLFQASKEPLDDPILLRCIGRDELLPQSVVSARRSEPPALEDQPIVASHHRGWPLRPQRPEAKNAGILDRPFGFLGSTAQRELPTDDLTIMAVDHAHQVGPAVATTVDVR